MSEGNRNRSFTRPVFLLARLKAKLIDMDELKWYKSPIDGLKKSGGLMMNLPLSGFVVVSLMLAVAVFFTVGSELLGKRFKAYRVIFNYGFGHLLLVISSIGFITGLMASLNGRLIPNTGVYALFVAYSVVCLYYTLDMMVGLVILLSSVYGPDNAPRIRVGSWLDKVSRWASWQSWSNPYQKTDGIERTICNFSGVLTLQLLFRCLLWFPAQVAANAVSIFIIGHMLVYDGRGWVGSKRVIGWSPLLVLIETALLSAIAWLGLRQIIWLIAEPMRVWALVGIAGFIYLLLAVGYVSVRKFLENTGKAISVGASRGVQGISSGINQADGIEIHLPGEKAMESLLAFLRSALAGVGKGFARAKQEACPVMGAFFQNPQGDWTHEGSYFIEPMNHEYDRVPAGCARWKHFLTVPGGKVEMKGDTISIWGEYDEQPYEFKQDEVCGVFYGFRGSKTRCGQPLWLNPDGAIRNSSSESCNYQVA